MSFVRTYNGEKILVVINLIKERKSLDLDGEILRNYDEVFDGTTLRPYEVQIIKK